MAGSSEPLPYRDALVVDKGCKIWAPWALNARGRLYAESMRGYCSRCGKEAGGYLRARLWQCPKCRMVVCQDCTPDKKVGVLFKKPVCPDCLIELIEGGLSFNSRSDWI